MTLTSLQENLLHRIENGELKFSPESENMTTEQFQPVARALVELAENGYKLLFKVFQEDTLREQSNISQRTNFQTESNGQKTDKIIRISQAARILNCSKAAIRTGRVGGFQTFKLNDKQKSPLFVRESEVLVFSEKLKDEKRAVK